MNKNVVFTGHRHLNRDKVSQIKKITKSKILELYNKGYRDFYCGMAIGFDLLAAQCVLSLKSTYQDIRLIAVEPFPGQSSNWSMYNKILYKVLKNLASEIITLESHYSNGVMLRRNDYMLDKCNIVICYYNNSRKGGTFYTVKRARKQGKEIYNVYE